MRTVWLAALALALTGLPRRRPEAELLRAVERERRRDGAARVASPSSDSPSVRSSSRATSTAPSSSTRDGANELARRRRAPLGRIAAQRHPARRRGRSRPPARHVARRDVPDRAALQGRLPRAARHPRVRARGGRRRGAARALDDRRRCRAARRSPSRSRASRSRSRRRRGTTWSPRRAPRSARSRARSRSGSRRFASARA